MKTIIILGALVISTGAFAQTRPQTVKAEAGKAQTEFKQKAETTQQSVKEVISQKKDETTQKVIQQVPKGKELVDGAKDYVNSQDKPEMVEPKISKGNAADAKLKATQVKTDADADAMIRMSKEDTKETVTSIDSKMVTARGTLMDKLTSGEITQTQFDEKMKKLMDFEKRKNSIVEKMN